MLGGFAYRLFDNTMLKLGYRYYDIDYSRGSGANQFGVDGNVHGPWIGIGFRF